MKLESLAKMAENLWMRNSKENTGRVVVFKEIGVKNSYTLESSYFRACPEAMKTANPDWVPPSSSIRYNNYLIDTRVIRISEDNLIEFGKFFAYVTNHYLHYKKAHQSAKIIEILGEEEEKVRVDDNKIETVSQPRIMSVKKNAGIESFVNNKRQPKFASSNERTLPAVSASAMRNKMDRPGKRTFLKKIKAKNTNLRIFRGENDPKPTQTCNSKPFTNYHSYWHIAYIKLKLQSAIQKHWASSKWRIY